MNASLGRIGFFGAWLLMALVIAATGVGLFFFVVAASLAGGDGTLSAIAGACFVLLIVELAVVARLMLRRRPRYVEPQQLP
jgi:hypothetical protein